MFRKAAVAAVLSLAVAGGMAATHNQTHNPSSVSAGDDAYYTNSDGVRVHRPVFADRKPDGATAQCADGSYSFSQHHRGTCSYHGGVVHWY